ncbi:MAG: Shikimate 5-dehydrogenase I alpha, partial [uncultured Acidimicrobiales bacterium]
GRWAGHAGPPGRLGLRAVDRSPGAHRGHAGRSPASPSSM